MKYMEIVSIERKTFEAMVAKFDHFVRRMEAICQRQIASMRRTKWKLSASGTERRKWQNGWIIRTFAGC